MEEKDKVVVSPTLPRFAVQFGEYSPTVGQEFKEPSQTVPDQSMTIPEIIAKFTRTGMVPGTISMRDHGGNIAADPESDPLDDYSAVQAAAAAAKAAGSSQAPQESAGEPEPSTPAPAGA